MINNDVSNRLKFGPRLLTPKQAAAYCGVSVAILNSRCPVIPIALGNSKRLERYDVQRLDEWIDTFRQNGGSVSRDWLAALGEDDDNRSRKGN
jgi:hypothetical protein